MKSIRTQNTLQELERTAMAWYKYIGTIDKISTDAPYQSLQVREFFAACAAHHTAKIKRKR